MSDTVLSSASSRKWYVLRDLKRPNAKERAWQLLSERYGMDVFTPKKEVVVCEKGRRVIKESALIPDLLFVHETRETLDPVVQNTETLQYRFVKGGAPNEAMTVPERDMDRFIAVVSSMSRPEYYSIDDITPSMRHRRIRIIGGRLNGYEGYLLSVRGSRKRRLLVELPNLIAASVEVSPEFIQIL